jgi:beta-N-acetylhexosaminidase
VTGELERQAAACIFASFPGPVPPDWIRSWVARGLGGVVLFADNVERVGELTSELRRENDVVIAIDEEGGDVTRLEAREGSSYPGNLALGVVDDTDLTERVAASIAAELARVGITMNLAPVADVNSNPQNPVIGVRSFGSDPLLVARHVRAFVAGTQTAGVAACAKHFPGHGDTAVDSHLDLPTVEGDLEEALLPFRAAIEVGVESVMTGHLLVPELDESPATISERIVTGLLRNELGFDGLVLSDALEMRAVADRVGIEEAAVRALAAGADALCLGRVQGEDVLERVHSAIVGAVQSGRLASNRVAEAADRVERAAGRASAQMGPDRELGAAAARRALRVRGDVSVATPPQVVELAAEPSIAAGPGGEGLGEPLRQRLAGTAVTVLDGPGDFQARDDRRLVVVMRDAARHEWQQQVATELVERHPDAVVVETGLAGWLPANASASIETYGAARVNLEAAAERIAPMLDREHVFG